MLRDRGWGCQCRAGVGLSRLSSADVGVAARDRYLVSTWECYTGRDLGLFYSYGALQSVVHGFPPRRGR